MHTAKGWAISTGKDGKYLLSSSNDKTARLWDVSNGSLLNIFRIPIGSGNEGQLFNCALSPNGKIAALSGWTGFEWDGEACIYLINTQTGNILHRIKGLSDDVTELEFSSDGEWMAAALKNDIRIFNTGGWGEYKKLEDFTTDLLDIEFNPKGGLGAISRDGKICIYDANFVLQKEKKESGSRKIHSLAFNPAGNLLALSYTSPASIEVRDASSLSLLYKPSVKGTGSLDYRSLTSLRFSAKGNRLYAGGGYDTRDENNLLKYAVRCWINAGKGDHYEDLLYMRSDIMDIKSLPDGSIAVLGSYPDMAVIDTSNKLSWHLSAGNIDYAADYKDHFRINTDGSSIGITPFAMEAYSFDIAERKLLEEESLYPSLVDINAGTTVTNWHNSYNPAINGKKPILSANDMCYCTDISSNGKKVAFGSGAYLYLFDNNAIKIWKTAIPGEAWVINISGNDKVITAALSDGTIRLYSMADGEELLAFYLDADKKRWVLFTPSGYYDAAPGAEDFLGWHVNDGPDKEPGFYPISRFRSQFYRPDIIDAIFKTYNETEAIALANKNKGIKNQPEPIADITKKLPSTIHISSPANGTTVSSNMVSISYTINSPADAPAKNIKVLVNGRPVVTERGLRPGLTGSQKMEVNIPQQDCTITLLVENDNGTSPEANLNLKWKAPDKPAEGDVVKKPTLYLLAIGISKYDKDNYKLDFAAKDANDFSSAILPQKGRLYNDVVTRTLTEKNATKINILNELQWIQKMTTSNDIAMIFFAGHGVNDNDGFYYMLPVDADVDHLRATSINFDEIKQIQSSIKGKVIVFIDACHSGNILGASGNYINGLVNLLTSTVRGAGAITFTSSTGKEESLEYPGNSPGEGNGAFTRALVEGLGGKASFGDEKLITYTSLSLYISQRVKVITGDKQHPTLVPTPNTPDFPIAVGKSP